MSSITRHKTYYFEDGNLVLLAETTLFKVHKSLFMFSPFFREVLSLPQSKDVPPQGFSDSNPIDIGGSDIPSELGVPSITAEDFSDFLSVMLPTTYKGIFVRSPESWGRVLKISTMLQFESIRIMAIMNLMPTADPLLMIELGSNHHHEPFVVEGIKRMSLCPRPIPFDATIALNAVTFFHLTSSREAIRTHLVQKLTVTDDAFNWQCDNYGDCSTLVRTQLSNLIIPRSADSTTSTHENKAYHHIARDTLRDSGEICDSCLTNWDAQIERAVDLRRIDEIIKKIMNETPISSRRVKYRRSSGN